jgi:microcystin-dependent protein
MFKSTTFLAALTAATLSVAPDTAKAQDYWIGQIILGGWNFCPRTTIPAAGQLLPISENTALFSLYGTTYGGDGRTTFGIPDLRGRYATSTGQQPGLSFIRLGEKSGAETHTMNVLEMPNHTHAIQSTATAQLHGSDGAVNSNTVAGAALADQASPHYAGRGALDQTLEDGSVSVNVTSTAGNTGGNQPFNIKDPFLGLQYCVVQFGIFPSRN